MRLLESFLETVSSDQTSRAYRSDVRRFFAQTGAAADSVSTIGVDEIQSFLRAMERNDEALSTRRRRMSALRGFFDWLLEEGICDQNPARHPQVQVQAQEDSRSNKSSLTKEEIESLVHAASDPPRTGPRDQGLILTIVYSALRRSEVVGLDVDDVRPLGRYWVLDLPGASNGGEYVRIPELVVDAIESMKDRYDITEGALWRSLSNRNRGARMSPDAVYKVVRRAAKRAGLDSVTIDVLRRSGLRLALHGGADLSKVKAHGRFSDASSAARLHDSEKPTGALGDSAIDYIELDLPKLGR